MPRTLIALTLTALLLGPSALLAQSPPDLSGTWRIDLERSVAGGGGRGRGTGQGNMMGGGLGLGPAPDVLTIRQDASGLTIEEHWSTGSNRLTYTFDGKETRNMVGVGRGASAIAFCRSVWKGDRLVTTLTVDAPSGRGFPRRFQDVRYVDKDGLLVVETTGAGAAGSRKAVYRRQPENGAGGL